MLKNAESENEKDEGKSLHKVNEIEEYIKENYNRDIQVRELAKLYFMNEKELKRILSEYGEERFAGTIASNIVKTRKQKSIETTGDLIEIIERSIPKKFQQDGHPAKRTFQAIRIEVNAELDGLYQTILDMARALKVGGRIAIITFHSLEDRIVKRAFKELECDCICDKSLPVCVCGKKSKGKVITRKPIIPADEEIEENKRSKSSKLRVFERR